MYRSPNVTRSTSVLLLFLMLPQLTGCGGYRPVVAPDPELQAAKPGTVYRLWTSTQRNVTVRGVHVTGDTIRAIRLEARRDSIVKLPRSEVRSVERATASPAGAVIGGLMIGVLLVGAAAGVGLIEINPQWGGLQ
jgi:hypothetical protein